MTGKRVCLGVSGGGCVEPPLHSIFSSASSATRIGPPESTIPRSPGTPRFTHVGAEVSNSGLQRMDQLVIFALTDAATAGIYGVVMMVVEMPFERFDERSTPLAAIFSRHASGEPERLKNSFSHATALAGSEPRPPFSWSFAGSLLDHPLDRTRIRSRHFSHLLICGFWLLNGALGLNGLILSGMGRSDSIL